MQVRRMGGVQAGNDQQSRTPETPEPSRTQLFLYAATAEPKQNPTSMREERGRTGDGAAPQGGQNLQLLAQLTPQQQNTAPQ